MSASTNEPEILIQVRDDLPGVQLQASSDAVIKGSRRNLEAAGALAKVAAETVGRALVDAAPTKGTVEFSISFEAEVGVPVLAKGKGTGSVTVTLEWDKK
jgi:Trypsin-co-occurring domain 1